ncbi:MAG: hypothetical protein Q4B92_02530 [Ruminococcus sp.]|nr:hypothetical protein [Ruminococcus sp.]
MNYERNTKYFARISYAGAVWMFIVGVFLFILSFTTVSILMAFGFLSIALGILIIVLKNKGKVSDEEYDSSVAANIDNFKQRALDKLGLDEDEVNEIEPIYFDGFELEGFKHFKVGKDNCWRTDVVKAVILFFSKDEVHCYTNKFCTTENRSVEATDVYFYKDIVSVSTASNNKTVQGTSVDYESFRLTTAGGTNLTVVIRDKGSAQRSINAMRSLLRSKKQG